MNKKTLLFIILFISFNFIFSVQAFDIGKSPNHPERKWKYIETDHFLVHYYQGFQKLANKTSKIAEDVYFKVTEDLDARPSNKVPIILTQDQFLNGYAEPIKNRIVLDPVLCNSSVIGARRFITHEFAHIITYEALSTGFPLSKIYSLSNVPVWFMEGVAQYEAEYWYPSYDRMLRLNMSENNMLTPTERNAFTVLGSHEGSAGYNEGYAIIKYLSENYGHDIVSKLIKEIKTENIPLSIAIKNITGKDFLELEANWRLSLQEKYSKQTLHSDKNTPKSNKFIKYKENVANIKPKLSFDKKILTYMSSKGRNSYISIRGKLIGLMPIYAELIKKSKKGTKIAGSKLQDEVFKENDKKGTLLTGGVIDYDWSSFGNKIVYSKITGDEYGQPDIILGFKKLQVKKDKIKSKTIYNHKYKIVNESGKKISLINYPEFNPFENEVSFVGTVEEITNIYKIDVDLLEQEESEIKAKQITFTNDYNYKDLEWSPNGKYLASVIYKPGDGGNIALFDFSNNSINILAETPVIFSNSEPSWSDDSKKLFFISDRDGISNIYSIDLVDKKLFKKTNSSRGLDFSHVINEDVYFSSHFSKGTDLKFVKITDLKNKFVKKISSRNIEQNLSNKKLVSGKNYFPVILPDLILPVTGVDEKGDQIGIRASMDDLLQQHSVNLALAYGLLSSRFSYSLSYVNRMFDPIMALQFGESPSIAATRDGEDFFFQRVTSLNFLMLRPFFNKISHQINNIGSIEFTVSNLEPVEDLTPENNDLVRRGWNNSLALNWTIRNAGGGQASDIHPKNGFKADFRFENANRFLGSKFEYTQFLTDIRKYIPVWFDHVVLLRGVSQFSFGDTTPLLLGGPPINLNMGIQNFTSLRGSTIAEYKGDILNMGSLEYRFPILTNLNTVFSGIFLDGIYGATFIDAGGAWFNGKDNANLNFGAGGELRFRLAIGNRSTLGVFIGAARKIPVSLSGENQYYFGFANSF